MALPTRRAALIPARNLSKVIDQAIQQAGPRLQGIETEPRLVRKWELIGRVVRDVRQAEKFAAEVSAELGPNVSPAYVKIDDKILAGFIEKVKIPQVGF